MPLPRKPHPKRSTSTRASRRHARDSAWVLAKLEERFDRFAEIAEQARIQHQQDAFTGIYIAKEKAPGLSTEGSIFFREKEELSG